MMQWSVSIFYVCSFLFLKLITKFIIINKVKVPICSKHHTFIIKINLRLFQTPHKHIGTYFLRLFDFENLKFSFFSRNIFKINYKSLFIDENWQIYENRKFYILEKNLLILKRYSVRMHKLDLLSYSKINSYTIPNY